MSEKRARYIGPNLDGVHLTVPVSTEGEPDRHVHVKHQGELPTEIDGHSVPASFRDSLLEQKDSWAVYNRSTSTAAKADAKKEA
jgi:hypothetical protein